MPQQFMTRCFVWQSFVDNLFHIIASSAWMSCQHGSLVQRSRGSLPRPKRIDLNGTKSMSWVVFFMNRYFHTFLGLLSAHPPFSFDLHRHLVRPGQVIVRLEYLSPALPHLTVLAAVCKSWNMSIDRVVQGQHNVNHHRLFDLAQRGFLTFDWSHSYHEDRFIYHADLIPETLLQRVNSPVHVR